MAAADREGWSRELVEEALIHADQLFNFARHLAGNRPDAEDLVQETYARAFAGSRHFTPGTHLRAWLFTILRNAFIDLERRANRLAVAGGLDAEVPVDPPPQESLRGDPELEQMRGLVGAEIGAALMRLSEEARAVVLMDVEGLTESEIAQVLGCAVGTVKSRLSRARAELRERLRDYRR